MGKTGSTLESEHPRTEALVESTPHPPERKQTNKKKNSLHCNWEPGGLVGSHLRTENSSRSWRQEHCPCFISRSSARSTQWPSKENPFGLQAEERQWTTEKVCPQEKTFYTNLTYVFFRTSRTWGKDLNLNFPSAILFYIRNEGNKTNKPKKWVESTDQGQPGNRGGA